ncbi:hypothetical protein DBV15_09840 [Temnothorax longispinosus]|uniref:Uncharacterized protein n=1 Tax=Temnothorax longispinosus TaxID=300112 RepID=A0A4S2L4E4_9HYME|nr:hypothetical protein DBV15_09840 [Temnothorax longispinosus]
MPGSDCRADQHLKIARLELDRRVIRVIRLISRLQSIFASFDQLMSIDWVSKDKAKTKTRARSGNGEQRDSAWSVGDQIVVASTGQGLPESAERVAPSARGPVSFPRAP